MVNRGRERERVGREEGRERGRESDREEERWREREPFKDGMLLKSRHCSPARVNRGN